MVAEQNNELLLKNHQSCSTDSAPFPEVNKTSFNNRGNNGQRRGRGKNNQYRGRRTYNSPRRNTTPYHQKWNHNETQQQEKGKGLLNKPPKAHEELCYRCGMKGHWSRTCRTAKHLVDLYQASMKEKGKEIEINHGDLEDPLKYDPEDPLIHENHGDLEDPLKYDPEDPLKHENHGDLEDPLKHENHSDPEYPYYSDSEDLLDYFDSPDGEKFSPRY